MPNPAPKRILKPGFLLIEIMCAFLILLIASSIMSFYLAMGQKRVKTAQNRMQALLVAQSALDQMRHGDGDLKHINRFSIQKSQDTLMLDWDDGKSDQVWAAGVRVSWHDTQAISLETILEQKAV